MKFKIAWISLFAAAILMFYGHRKINKIPEVYMYVFVIAGHMILSLIAGVYFTMLPIVIRRSIIENPTHWAVYWFYHSVTTCTLELYLGSGAGLVAGTTFFCSTTLMFIILSYDDFPPRRNRQANVQ